MEVLDSPLVGLKRVRLEKFVDARGFFLERINAHAFELEGLPSQFVQENHSRSLPGVIRGLHFQWSPAQSKLVGVVRGRIWDVALDIRPWSMTYGRYYAAELSDENAELLWIPAGFAHGFCVLGDEAADVLYHTDAPYEPACEGGIRFDDPELAIAWPVSSPVVSERDRRLPSWLEYRQHPPSWEQV